MTVTDTSPTPVTRVLAALALELVPGSQVAHHALPQRDAGALAQKIARDLATHHADAAQLQMATVAAHYDPVELLRPHWPLHEQLLQLAARAPVGKDGDHGRIIAFGTHDGRLPGALTPSTEFQGGPLRLLPVALEGDADIVAGVGAALEAELMERGMAAADTALAMQEAFGLRIEHARYLTVHDLCAMTALQYEHAGLAPLWPILETALFAPDREAWLDAPPEPLLHYVDREARIALFSADTWRRRYAGDVDADASRLAGMHAQFEARQRQFASVLQAHGVAVTFAHCGADAAADL